MFLNNDILRNIRSVGTMKKRPWVLQLALLLCILLMSGCTEKTNTFTGKFIGTWKTMSSPSDNETWTFYQNGTVKNRQFQVLDDIPINSTTWFNYHVNTTDLCLSSIETSPEAPSNYSECFSYKFSETMDRVTLSFKGTEFMLLEKIR
jgi:hypothetical protein